MLMIWFTDTFTSLLCECVFALKVQYGNQNMCIATCWTSVRFVCLYSYSQTNISIANQRADQRNNNNRCEITWNLTQFNNKILDYVDSSESIAHPTHPHLNGCLAKYNRIAIIPVETFRFGWHWVRLAAAAVHLNVSTALELFGGWRSRWVPAIIRLIVEILKGLAIVIERLIDELFQLCAYLREVFFDYRTYQKGENVKNWLQYRISIFFNYRIEQQSLRVSHWSILNAKMRNLKISVHTDQRTTNNGSHKNSHNKHY